MVVRDVKTHEDPAREIKEVTQREKATDSVFTADAHTKPKMSSEAQCTREHTPETCMDRMSVNTEKIKL